MALLIPNVNPLLAASYREVEGTQQFQGLVHRLDVKPLGSGALQAKETKGKILDKVCVCGGI